MRNRRTRTVIGAGGRTWVLRRSIIWRAVPSEYQYEHDIASGQGIVIGGLILFWCVIVYMFVRYRPAMPWPVWVVVAVAAVAFALWWVHTRQWSVVAESTNPAERWYGVIRGRSDARAELRAVERSIRMYGTPAREGGLLSSTTSTLPILKWPGEGA